jgi:uncharacterized protein (DUF1501 family)
MQLPRRRLLQVGSLGAVGLALPRLLWAEAAAGGAAEERSCIFVVQYGGASHIDTLDPKPDAPADVRSPYAPIATSVPGIVVSDRLPRLALLADRFTLVRSMSHTNGGHDGGMHVCMTGHSRPTERTPYFGSVAARLRPATRNVPSYVWLQNLAGDVQPWYLTGGFLGAAYSPMLIGKDEENLARDGFRVTEFDPPEGVSAERQAQRQSLLASAESAGVARSDLAARSFEAYRRQAADLVSGAEARQAFDLEREPAATRDRYGRHALGQNLLMARRLIEAGVRLVTVNAWCGRSSTDDVLATQGWDHHGAEIQKCGIFDERTFGLGFVLPRFDEALSALLEDLGQRGRLATTLVVVVGEFGRTPRIVSNPYPGRDHWPQCYTALLAGAGIRRGAVYGASDAHGGYVASRPVTPENFGATILSALGIPPHTRFGPDGFSERASDGEPVAELFG